MDRDEKIRRLEALLEIESDDPLTHFLLGREYMDAERWEEAAQMLQRCVDLKPTYTAAYRFLGDSHRRMGDDAGARQAYQSGIDVAQETGDLQAGKEMEVLLKRLEKS
ncbi:tetratricopeptide repeat protein [bacterium]|nr:tetratricopeptide repeat protein [bacterium]